MLLHQDRAVCKSHHPRQKPQHYLANHTEKRWGDISRAVTKIAHTRGLIATDLVDKLSVEDATALHPWGPILWGGNSRGSAERLKTLGWKVSGKSIADSLAAMVEFEATADEGMRQKLTFAHK
jgi:hypothetical protein